jgi:hypothetical protein
MTRRESPLRQDFVLRRSFAPYIGLLLIATGTTILTLYVSLKTSDLGPLEATAVIWLFVAALVFIGTRYRIFWREDAILQKASGGADVEIAPREITSVALEVSAAATMMKMSRPFRRIAIYAEHDDGNGCFIDVSLKHFVEEDIRHLMRNIQAARPDLALPEHWL